MDRSLLRVGSIIDIDGPQVMFSRNLGTRLWYQAHVGMVTYMDMVLRAGPKTTCVVEFLVGGRASFSNGVTVQIASYEHIQVIDNGRTNRFGIDVNMFDLIDKKETPFRIQTSGGAFGIEG